MRSTFYDSITGLEMNALSKPETQEAKRSAENVTGGSPENGSISGWDVGKATE